MPEPEPFVSLGLNSPVKEIVPRPEDLQFEHAVPIPGAAPAASENKLCVPCQTAIIDQYFHAQGQVVCPACAGRIEAGQQAPPPVSLLKAALYGAGAAFAGATLYALVAIITGLQIGLLAILVGLMVGKAIRHGSGGLGGRPQQILAVALTYFAITTSYIPVFIYDLAKNPHRTAQNGAKAVPPTGQSKTGAAPAVPKSSGTPTPAPRPKMSFLVALTYILLLALVAPFLSLTSGFSGLLTIVIIFFGLQRAWHLTGRTEIHVAGPYSAGTAG
jgi:hypothetical protein